MEVDSKQFYQPLIAMIVAVILIATVMMPIVTSLTQTTITTDIENDNAGWLKLGYAEGTDFDFEITNDGADVTVGEQTGSLGEMIYYADSDRVIFSKGTSMYMLTDGDNPTVYTFTNAVSVTNTAGTLTILDGSTEIATAESPSWAYYPDANGVYGFFTDGNLNLEEGKPEVAVGGYAGVFAYNDTVVTPDNIDLGLVMDGDYATGDVEWIVESEENDDEPAQPLASQPTMVTMSKYSEITVMGTANPSNGTQVGDLYYTFSGTNATVVGYSSSIDWSTFTSIPDTVTYDGVTYTIISIGGNAFDYCTDLALTSLPSGLKTIGSNAFRGCTSLALTSLPDSVTTITGGAFSSCTNLALTSLPSGLTNISSQAFYKCTNLALTSLPDGVTFIDSQAFEQCTNLALTSLPSGLTSIGNSAFSKCTNLALTSLPSGVTSIGTYAFSGCTSLTVLSILGSPTIGSNAFYGCTNLKTIVNCGTTPITTTSYGLNADIVVDIATLVSWLTFSYDDNHLTATVTGYTQSVNWSALVMIPDTVEYNGSTYTVTKINNLAFRNCTDLKLTSLPNGLTTIGVQAFEGCSNLALSELPSGVYSIGQYAFKNCTSLALTSLPNLNGIGIGVFFGCTNLALTTLPSSIQAISTAGFMGCTSLALTTVPDSVTSIGDGAFAECTNLTSFTIPTTTTIGKYVFRGCSNLSQVTLPTGLTSVNENLFENCTNLVQINHFDSITSIGKEAFLNCTSLALTSLPSGLTSIGNSAFKGCTSLALTSLPSELTSIESNAFFGCTDLALTSIPSEVTNIGNSVFNGCSSIKSMIFLGSPTIGNNVFANTGIKEVLNLGETEITTTSYGLNADSVQDYVSALGYVAPTVIHEEEVVTDDSITATLLRLLPIMLVLSVLLFVGITLLNPNSDWIRKH